MAWEDPVAFAGGEFPPASKFNKLVNALKALGDPWTAFGSGASWTAATTNPVLNNGTWAAAYQQTGKRVRYRFRITAGSTTTFGSGQYRIALPVAAHADEANPGNLRLGGLRDVSAPGTHAIVLEFLNANTLVLGGFPTTAGNALVAMTATVPVALANGDQIFGEIEYEAA